MTRPLVGLLPWEPAAQLTFAALASQAERAEKWGFHSLWLPELHFSERSTWPSPLLGLAAAAARSSRLRLGTTSYLLPIRDPVQVAEDVALLDRLSSGRVILGLGRGFQPSLFAAFGVPIAEKRRRFEANLDIIRRAWAGEALAHTGDGGEPVHLIPRPVQQPHPPLWVAAFGPKAIRQAARLGLPYLSSPAEPFERLEHNYSLHRDELEDRTLVSKLPVPIMRSVFLTRSAEAERRVLSGLRDQAVQMARGGLRPLRWDSEPDPTQWALIGEPERVLDDVARYRERIGMTHLIASFAVPGATPVEVERSIEMLTNVLI